MFFLPKTALSAVDGVFTLCYRRPFKNSLTPLHELMPVLMWLIELLSDQLHEFYGLKVGDEKILTFLSPH